MNLSLILETRTIPEPNSGCLLWVGATTPAGYGKIGFGGKPWNGGRCRYVHRLVWEAEHGPIPDGFLVCHKCDVPSCVNVNHLFLGTKSDNAMDAVSKGRAAMGERHYASKLTAAQVEEIRRRVSDGEVQREVARDYPVGYKAINKIVLRQRWRPKA